VIMMGMMVVAVRCVHACALGNIANKKKKPRAPRGNSARGFNARFGSVLEEDYWSSFRTFCWLWFAWASIAVDACDRI